MVEVKAPRVNGRRIDEATGERNRLSSATLPPWCRKSPKINNRLPRQWWADHTAFTNDELSEADYVCVWADEVSQGGGEVHR
ncbi:hypothetical protein RI578_38680 [Streptomyces sp. BB1-1-1]|uniref:hypothetical protein n=1 Tax=Streptomyces sp. BB1-1-1 TaxID=3074430 RepID=UPI0028776EFA|nr:hypothetical protein [Streptomyces sp. BB1-1-1]WND39856.1 hypothetical protein RI578_38680 [Streptomyces sp. BB1-1-1]